MAERKTIKIISVGQWKDVGKAKVLTFAGEDRVNYETWSPELAEHVKVGATIEADVEFSENVSQGVTYFHNKVVQIYIDGQPVKSKQRGYSQDSPEKIASIESQKRADLICQLWIAGKIDAGADPLIGKVRAWLDKLGCDPKGSSKVASPAMTDTFSPVKGEVKTGDFANAGEFLMACSKPPLKMTKTQVITKLKSLGVSVSENFEGVNFIDAYQVLKDELK